MLDDAKFPTRPPAQDVERARTVSELTESFLERGFLDQGVDDMAKSIGRPVEQVELVGSTAESVHLEIVRAFFRDSARRVSASMSGLHDPHRRLAAFLDSVSKVLARASDAFLADVADCRAAQDVYRFHTMRAVMTVRKLMVEAQADALPDRASRYRFVGALAGQLMEAIHSGELEAETSLSDSAAYLELAHVVTTSLSIADARSGNRKSETK